MQLVMRNGKEFVGVADPRRDGSAAGPVKIAEKKPEKKSEKKPEKKPRKK